MSYWRIENSSDGIIVIIEAETVEDATRKYYEQYAPDIMVDESNADEYADFQRDWELCDGPPWFS